MIIKPIINQVEWDNFQTGRAQAQFLQSWAWGEFQRSRGRELVRWGFYKGEKLSGAAQLFWHHLPFGFKYLYGPRLDLPKETVPLFFDFLKKESGGRTIMSRLEFKEPLDLAGSLLAHSSECRQPAASLLLDLSLSLEDLLAKMRQKNRYNIRLSQKKGLTAEIGGSWAEFWPILEETARREKIIIYPVKYYEQMLKFMNGINTKSWLIAVKHQERMLAGGIFIGYGDTFTYLHGASSRERREMMAPHLLHWTAIGEAKRSGYKYYDFWGVNPTDRTSPAYQQSWEGISRFKMGFGGRLVNYGPCLELPTSELWYNLYQLARLIMPS